MTLPLHPNYPITHTMLAAADALRDEYNPCLFPFGAWLLPCGSLAFCVGPYEMTAQIRTEIASERACAREVAK